MSVKRAVRSPASEVPLRHPRRTSKPASYQGRERLGFHVSLQETAMQSWVDEVGRELRDVEGEIAFFRHHVDATFHGHGVNQ
jgi:hypothetical protein